MSYKYDKIGFRRDKNLSDAASGRASLDNLLNDLALPGEFFTGDDIRVINGLSQTPVTNLDIANFKGTAPKASQNRWTLKLEVKVPTESILFDPGLQITFNGFNLVVIVYTSPVPINIGDLSQGYKFDLFVQTDVRDTGISSGDIIDLVTQQVEVLDVISNIKTIEEFTVEPLITIKDQKEFYDLTTGTPRSGKGGEGLKAVFLPSSQIDYNAAANGVSINNTLVNSPQAYGPFDYWDSGLFAYSNRIYDSNAFRDGGGGILWEGWLTTPDFYDGVRPLMQIDTNGQVVVEQWDEEEEKWVPQSAIRNNIKFTGEVAGDLLILQNFTQSDIRNIAVGSTIIVPSYDSAPLKKIDGSGEDMRVTGIIVTDENTSISVAGGISGIFPPQEVEINGEIVPVNQVINFELANDVAQSNPRTISVNFTKRKHFNEKVKIRILSFFDPMDEIINYGGFKWILFTDSVTGGALKHTSLYDEYEDIGEENYNKESIVHFYKNTVSRYNEHITAESSLDVDGLLYVDLETPVTRENIVSRTEYVMAPNRKLPDELKEGRDIKFAVVESFLTPGAFKIDMSYNDTDLKVGDYITLVQSNKYAPSLRPRGFKQKNYKESLDEFQKVTWLSNNVRSSDTTSVEVNTDTVVSTFKIIALSNTGLYGQSDSSTFTIFVDSNDIAQHNSNIPSGKREFTFPPYFSTTEVDSPLYDYRYTGFFEEDIQGKNWIPNVSTPLVFAIIYPGEGLLDVITTADPSTKEDDPAKPRVFKSTMIENENVTGMIDVIDVGNIAFGLNFASDLRYVDRFSSKAVIKQYEDLAEGSTINVFNHGYSTWDIVTESLQSTSPGAFNDLLAGNGVAAAIVEVINDNVVKLYSFDTWVHEVYEASINPDLFYWSCRNSKAGFKPSDFSTSYREVTAAASWQNAYPINWLDITPTIGPGEEGESTSSYFQGYQRRYVRKTIDGEWDIKYTSGSAFNFASMLVSEIKNPVFSDTGRLDTFDIVFHTNHPITGEPIEWHQWISDEDNAVDVYMLAPFLDDNVSGYRHWGMPPLRIVSSDQIARTIQVKYPSAHVNISETVFEQFINNDYTVNLVEIFDIADSISNISEIIHLVCQLSQFILKKAYLIRLLLTFVEEFSLQLQLKIQKSDQQSCI
jgi:hypothetical protein